MADHVEVLRQMLESTVWCGSPEDRDALQAAIRALSPAGGDWVMVPREAVAQAAAALDILGRRDLAAWLMRYVAASPQQKPVAACPHIVQSKEGTAYCRLAESAGGGGGVPIADIEVMRNVFDSMPTSLAKTAYAAVKTYIDCCNAIAGKPSLFDSLTPASPAAPQPQDSMQVIECGGCAPPVIATPARGAGEGDDVPDSEILDALESWSRIVTNETPQLLLTRAASLIRRLTARPTPEAQDPSGQTLAGVGGDAVLRDQALMLREMASRRRVCGNSPGEVFDLEMIARSLDRLAATSAGTTGDDSEDAARLEFIQANRVALIPESWDAEIGEDGHAVAVYSGTTLRAAIDAARRARGESA